MGTRAVYTFKADDGEFAVYKHWDGYPEGAAEFITKAIPLAWELPRFEAMDFSAAFIAANKTEGGNVYNTASADAHGDLSFFYEISQAKNGQLIMKAFDAYNPSEPLFYGRLKDFVKKYGRIETRNLWDTLVPSTHKIGSTDEDMMRVKGALSKLAEENGFSIASIELV